MPRATTNALPAPKERKRIGHTTTARALTIRNGKYGSMGTGEVVLSRKIQGREKLELLAEDKMKNTLKAPFDLEKLQKVVQARIDVYLDDIQALHEPDQCSTRLETLLLSSGSENLLKDATWVTKEVAAIIHNTYLVASGWNLLSTYLTKLEDKGLDPTRAYNQLRSSEEMRTQYLHAWLMAKKLVLIEQYRLRLKALHAPHYQLYFQQKSHDRDGAETVLADFNLNKLREVHRSFMDSIILEICIPDSPYPLPVLLSMLHERSEESAQELDRFPQAMFDAIGDLSDAVEVMDLLEAPLLSLPPATKKVTTPDFLLKQWERIQLLSENAIERLASSNAFPILPLSKLAAGSQLKKFWIHVNSCYVRECERDIDQLWGLTGAGANGPQWHTYFISEEDYEALLAKSGKGKLKPLRLTGTERKLITYGEDDDEFAGLPDLVDNSATDTEESDNEEDYSGPSSPAWSESDFALDEEDEEEERRQFRKAMDAYFDDPDVFDEAKNDDKYAEERKGNPFLDLLGKLKGRLFDTKTTIKTAGRGHPKQDADEKSVDGQGLVQSDEADRKKRGKKGPEGATSPVIPDAKPSVDLKRTPTVDIPFETINADDHAQSGRAFVKSQPQEKTKVKTRPDQPVSPQKEKKKSFFGKKTPKNDAALGAGGVEESPTYIQTAKKKFEKIATGFRKLFPQTKDDKKGGMKWEEFCQVLISLSFVMDGSTAGSSVRFDPADPRDRSITFHKPHPDPTLTPHLVKVYGNRLRRAYGCSETFLMKVFGKHGYDGADDSLESGIL